MLSLATMQHPLLCSLLLASFTLSSPPTGNPILRISHSPAAGLGAEAGVGRLDPSEVLLLGNRHVVLYTRVTSTSPLYPAPFAGEIWWASSMDAGHHWKEEGALLTGSGGEALDGLGVFDPTVVKDEHGDLHLFYGGIGQEFNFRFERHRRPETTHLFQASLTWDDSTQRLSAKRSGNAQPILSPSSVEDQTFDSRRVRQATALAFGGRTHLYYQGLVATGGTQPSSTGLARQNPKGTEFSRCHDGAPVFPIRGEALLQRFDGGVLAIFSRSTHGAFWAADGEQFAPLEARVHGQLNNPGILRTPQSDWDGVQTRWGLHVAQSLPNPCIERFELRVEGQLTAPTKGE